MSNLAAFLAEVLGPAFTYELVLLVLFVFFLNIRRSIWNRLPERPVEARARVTEPVRVIIIGRERR